MKYPNYNQIQLIMFTGIFFLFSSAIISHRYFIEQPKLEDSISKISQRELTSISLFTNKSLESLQSVVYSYGVWDSAYSFVQKYDQGFIKENIVLDTFISLQVDGIFILDKNFNLIFGKGLHHGSEKILNFDFYDLEKHPKNRVIASDNKALNGLVGNFGGVISTLHGPALFSSQSIKKTDKTGDFVGFIIFIQLIEEPYLKQLEKFSFAEIKQYKKRETSNSQVYLDWFTPEILDKVVPYSYRTINDIHNTPLVTLQIKHTVGALPPLLDINTALYIFIFVCLMLFVFVIFSSIVITPIKRLANDIKIIGDEDELGILTEAQPIDELNNVSRHFNKLINTVRDQQERLNQQALIDPLTGINNRRAFEIDLERHCQLFIRENTNFALVMIDVDHFKLFNDALGHVKGDQALIKTSKILQQTCKRKNDTCARYGGEEFVLLFSNISKEYLEQLLQRILDDFAELNLAHPTSPTTNHLTVSLGASLIETPPHKVINLTNNSIIHTADNALYQAKDSGRNCFKLLPFYKV